MSEKRVWLEGTQLGRPLPGAWGNAQLNMTEDEVVERLKAGLPVTCDHNTYEAASRRVSAEQQVQAAAKQAVTKFGSALERLSH